MRLDSAVRSSRRPWVGPPPSTSTELASPCVALSHPSGGLGHGYDNYSSPENRSQRRPSSDSQVPDGRPIRSWDLSVDSHCVPRSQGENAVNSWYVAKTFPPSSTIVTSVGMTTLCGS